MLFLTCHIPRGKRIVFNCNVLQCLEEFEIVRLPNRVCDIVNIVRPFYCQQSRYGDNKPGCESAGNFSVSKSKI